MCTQASTDAYCAAVVAHEMGHNFGMRHDGDAAVGTQGCANSGYIMAAVGGGVSETVFSSCSATFINDFFQGGGGAPVGQ